MVLECGVSENYFTDTGAGTLYCFIYIFFLSTDIKPLYTSIRFLPCFGNITTERCLSPNLGYACV